MTDSVLPPYLVREPDNVLHVDIPKALEYFGYPDTPENREVLADVFTEACREHFPAAEINVE